MTPDLRALAARLDRWLGDRTPFDHDSKIAVRTLRSAADQLDAQEAELMRTWFVLKDFGYHPGRADDKLADCVRAGLDAQKAELDALQRRCEGLEKALKGLMRDIEQGADPLDPMCRKVTGSWDDARAALETTNDPTA